MVDGVVSSGGVSRGDADVRVGRLTQADAVASQLVSTLSVPVVATTVTLRPSRS